MGDESDVQDLVLQATLCLNFAWKSADDTPVLIQYILFHVKEVGYEAPS